MSIPCPYCNGLGRIVQTWTDPAGRAVQREVDCPACRPGHPNLAQRTQTAPSWERKWWQFWKRPSPLRIIKVRSISDWPAKCAACGATSTDYVIASCHLSPGVVPVLGMGADTESQIGYVIYPVCRFHRFISRIGDICSRKTLFNLGIFLITSICVAIAAVWAFNRVVRGIPIEDAETFRLVSGIALLGVAGFLFGRWFTPVRLVAISATSITLAFRNEAYAREFEELNGLNSVDDPILNSVDSGVRRGKKSVVHKLLLRQARGMAGAGWKDEHPIKRWHRSYLMNPTPHACWAGLPSVALLLVIFMLVEQKGYEAYAIVVALISYPLAAYACGACAVRLGYPAWIGAAPAALGLHYFALVYISTLPRRVDRFFEGVWSDKAWSRGRGRDSFLLILSAVLGLTLIWSFTSAWTAQVSPEERVIGRMIFFPPLLAAVGLVAWKRRPRHSQVDLDPLDQIMYRSFDKAEAARLIQEGLYAISFSGRNKSIQANILCKLARFSFNQADYATARSLFNESLDLTRQVCGEGHTDCAIARCEMAMLYEVMGVYHEAESLYQQALNALLCNFGERHLFRPVPLGAGAGPRCQLEFRGGRESPGKSLGDPELHDRNRPPRVRRDFDRIGRASASHRPRSRSRVVLARGRRDQ
jgi:tetratricopeptide (TPR) repeat protein